MPVLDWDPGQSPEAPGTLYFYEQGADPSTGLRATSKGELLAPGNDALAWPPAEFQPADFGLKGWAYDPALITGGTIAVNGGLYMTRIPVRKGYNSVAVWWTVTTAGVTPTAGQNVVGIYDTDGDLLNSVNVDAQISSTGQKRSVLAAPLLPSYVDVAWVFNAATPPTLGRGGSFETAPNPNLSGASLRFAKNGAGLTALPASLNMANKTTSGALNWWAAIE